MNTKVCTICNTTKDATKDYYSRLSRGKIYDETICITCVRERQNERNRSKPVNEKLHRSAKSSARKRGLEFSIEPADIIVPEFCPILNERFDLENQGRGGCPLSPSIDRINNSKGYVKGNIWVISLKANRCKSDLTLEQLENMVRVIKEKEEGCI